MYKIYHDNLGFIKIQALTIINGSLLNFKLIFKPTLFILFIYLSIILHMVSLFRVF